MREEEKEQTINKKPDPDEKNPAEAENKEEGDSKIEQQDIILKVHMHCEGCARKVRRCLKGLPGVDDVATDRKASTVTVKGEKADPLMVLERLRKKSAGKVELLSPVQEPKKEEAKETKQDGNITAVLRIHMHCESCAFEIKKRIMRMKGVDSVEADVKGSEVAVKGVFEASDLVDFVGKRTGKQVTVVRETLESRKEEDKKEDEKDENQKKEEKEEKKEDGSEGTTEVKRTEQGYPPMEMMHYYSYPPQLFSDENPNACVVM